MQLVLVDTLDVVKMNTVGVGSSRRIQDNLLKVWVAHKGTLSSGALKRKRDHDDGNEVGSRLVPEILANVDTLGVNLMIYPEKNIMEFKLTSLPYGPNVYERLWKRFQGKVKLSVCVKYASHVGGELLDFAEIKGLKIKPKGFLCFGSVHTDKMKFEQQQPPVMHLKIVADVPDRLIFANQEDTPTAKKILENEKFSDVTIITGNGVEIRAHKAFLSASSSVLEAMFDNDMEESNTGRLDMTDISRSGVEAFLRFVYYNDLKMTEEHIDVAFQVLYAAHKYNMRCLEAKMTTCLLERKNEDFPTELAFRIYMFTRNIESSYELKEKAVQVLKMKLDELEQLDEYKDLFLKSSNANIAMEIVREFSKPSSF